MKQRGESDRTHQRTATSAATSGRGITATAAPAYTAPITAVTRYSNEWANYRVAQITPIALAHNVISAATATDPDATLLSNDEHQGKSIRQQRRRGGQPTRRALPDTGRSSEVNHV